MNHPTAYGHLAVELLQSTAILRVGSGQWKSCNALPPCWGQGVVELCNAPPYYLRVVGGGILAMHRHIA